MRETQWWQYVTNLIGSDSFKDAAEKAGFDKSAFSRWKRGAKADPEFAVKLARAYRASVLQALVKSGLITQKEANLREVQTGSPTVEDASDIQLADEVLKRMKRGSELMDKPLSEIDAAARAARLEDELEARRAASESDAGEDVRGLDYAADASDTEPEEGDDDYHDGP